MAQDRLKDYIPVAERIADFYGHHPNGRIITTIVEHKEETGFVLMRAEVYREADDAQPSATGHAFEVKGQGHVNQTSHIENCETGAVGRALANLGLETKRGGAERAPRQDAARPPKAAPAKPPGPVPVDNPEEEHNRLDRAIREALGVLGRKEPAFNKWVQEQHETDSDWFDLSIDTKREILADLNAMVDKQVAAAK